jgi:hypothetical protein
MNSNDLKNLNDFEDDLIKKFSQHTFFQTLTTNNWEKIHHVLLQRRFVSHIFTPIYDLIIDGFTDIEAKKLVRILIREEYPDAHGNTPSHREDLFHDLTQLGITSTTIWANRPSEKTQLFIQQCFEQVYILYNEKDETLRNLGLLLMVRFWGEILISSEYKALWLRLSERLEKKKSLFYHQHYLHDQKKKALFEPPSVQMSHADRTNQIIIHYLQKNQEAVVFFKTTEQALFDLKISFYEQF